jgi:glycosyltransferase involved in cell wall biosynthesis
MTVGHQADFMKVSVCMAVYNGATFLASQVQSILQQLRPDDELIVVDDASNDDSSAILARFADARVAVHRNERNRGVLASFERALAIAKGDVIFLSDHDDVWLPGKVDKALAVYRARPTVTMVASDVRLIDEEGRTVEPSFFARRGRFASGAVHNFVKNKYLGCTLSFRRGMLRIFLPIPPDVPMHDIWFGILNGIYGETHFLDEPLVAYRRHGGNASPIVSPGFGRAAIWRLRLAKNLAGRVLRHALSAR